MIIMGKALFVQLRAPLFGRFCMHMNLLRDLNYDNSFPLGDQNTCINLYPQSKEIILTVARKGNYVNATHVVVLCFVINLCSSV